jgi:hypothetical protein
MVYGLLMRTSINNALLRRIGERGVDLAQSPMLPAMIRATVSAVVAGHVVAAGKPANPFRFVIVAADGRKTPPIHGRDKK